MSLLKIVAIVELDEMPMCDIQVSGDNLFYANRILTHNSAIVATREQTAIGQDHIQGGISKINTSDLVIALVKDEAMDAEGIYRFEFLKARNSNAVNKKLTMAWNHDSLLITDLGLKLVSSRPSGKKLSLGDIKPGKKVHGDGLSDLLGRK